MFASIFSLQLWPETFLILRRIQAKYCHKCTLVFVWSTHYCCQILLKLGFSWQIFKKYSNIRYYENPSSGNRVVPCRRADRQTDRHDETNSRFSQLCKPTKNEYSLYISLHNFSFLESFFFLLVHWKLLMQEAQHYTIQLKLTLTWFLSI